MDHENREKRLASQVIPDRRVAPGTVLAERFRLVRHLDHGGLGDVWLAEDIALENERVACKLLRDDVLRDPRAIAELKREVLLTRRLRHPNILGVYTFWESEGEPFITMEYVDGNDLGDALHQRDEPYPPHDAAEWLRQLANALDYAHAQGVLHRDVKPGNILLDERNHVRLGDFGIARTVNELHARSGRSEASGTVYYMSPEQIAGDNVGPASDQYNLAVTLYELLSGTPPFHQGSVVSQIQLRTPDAITSLSPALNQVLLRAMSKKPDDRYETCTGFYEAYAAVLATISGGISVVTADSPDESPGHDAETTVLPPQRATTLYLRLGTILIEDGVVSVEQLETALTAQQERGERIGRILIEMGFADAEAIARGLARQLHVPYSSLRDETPDHGMLAMLSGNFWADRACIPVRREHGLAVVAMADPLDLITVNELERALGTRIAMVIATESAVADCLQREH